MITVCSGGEGLETLTNESHSSLADPGPQTISLIPSHSFQTSAISKDFDTAANTIITAAYKIYLDCCFDLIRADYEGDE